METSSPRSFIRRVVETAFRQVSWLGPLAIDGDAAFSRISAQWLTKRRFKGLTVAVTTRDSHPLPYSLVAEGDEHLKTLTKNLKS